MSASHSSLPSALNGKASIKFAAMLVGQDFSFPTSAPAAVIRWHNLLVHLRVSISSPWSPPGRTIKVFQTKAIYKKRKLGVQLLREIVTYTEAGRAVMLSRAIDHAST
jgi:hypothetical protein